jgi:serine/threonine-protein kinase
MLTARLPFYAGNVTDILKLVIEAPPEPPRRVKPEIPADLEAIVLRCMEKDRERRYDTAGEVGRELERFIRGEPVRAGRGGGARRARSVVLALLLAAAAGAGGFFAGRASAPGASGAAPEAAGAVPAAQGAPRGPIDDPAAARTAEAKRLVEAGQGALARAERGSGPDAARAEAEAIEAFGAALGLSPGSPDALAGLASIYLRRGRDAEMRGDGALAAAFFELVRSHDPGGLYAPALGTTATLSIRTAPGGARIAVDRVVPVEGVGETRRERVFEAVDPVAPRPLPAGSYVIEATAPGFMKATVPILLERLGREDVAVRLLRPVEIPPGFAYIPAGPFLAGSDGRAVRAQPRGRVEVPGFFLGSCEVSCAEYAEFLGSLPRDDALRLAPRGGAARGHALLFWPEGGAFRFPPAWPPERPVTGVPFEGALRYAIWRGAKDGRGPYRLPTELEWEKACRGADGRTWPWGEAAPAGRAVVSIEGRAVRPAAVGATPGDVSIYGVHDLAGNAAEWTSSNLDARLLYRIVRGGAYAPIPDEPLPAARFPTPVDDPPEYVGFRLACDLPE